MPGDYWLKIRLLVQIVLRLGRLEVLGGIPIASGIARTRKNHCVRLSGRAELMLVTIGGARWSMTLSAVL